MTYRFPSGWFWVCAGLMAGVTVVLMILPSDTPLRNVPGASRVLPQLRHEVPLVAVIIENQESARPHQSGLREALLVEEWVVEGYISRFVVLFDARRLPDRVGPVRSVRPYLIQGVRPWTETFVHAGGSPEAYDLLNGSEYLRGINGLSGTYTKAFYRDPDIAAPHNFFGSGAVLRSLWDTASMPSVRWPPDRTGRPPSGSGAVTVEIDFHSPVHNVTYRYDAKARRYIRQNGYVENQAAPANVLIVEVPVRGEGELGRLDIPVEGSGAAALFARGSVQHGTWHKSSSEATWMFRTDDGEPFIFVSGQTWLTAVPSWQRLTWTNIEDADN